jgi:hypothetical protein
MQVRVKRLKDEELKGQVVGRFEGRKVERRQSLRSSVLAKACLADSAQFSAKQGEVSSGE